LPLHNQEVFVSHRNARLTVHGRRLLVERVRSWGWKIILDVAALGVEHVTTLTEMIGEPLVTPLRVGRVGLEPTTQGL
jgi:hypothetical protein